MLFIWLHTRAPAASGGITPAAWRQPTGKRAGAGAGRAAGSLWTTGCRIVYGSNHAGAPDKPARVDLGDIDPAKLVDLEVGPLCWPIVRKSDGEILYRYV